MWLLGRQLSIFINMVTFLIVFAFMNFKKEKLFLYPIFYHRVLFFGQENGLGQPGISYALEHILP